ncbi:MAG: sigma-54-dependent transcriptional regulator [Desulfovibrionaceae bacterium]
MANVLVIDDDTHIREVCKLVIEGMGHEVTACPSLTKGVEALDRSAFDVVYLDVDLPDGNGLLSIPRIIERDRAPEVIIFTGASYPNGAELAIKNGAWDYIEKPATAETMTLPLIRALQYRKEKFAHRPPTVALKREGIIGNSNRMVSCLDLVAQAANTDANTLITGETGTGKELFARAIHDNSDRAQGPFVVVDCSSLTETLIESVLFGHAKGAFTGAEKKQEGLIKQADKGTLFLDEVGELPFAQQKAFLRVLQERRFRPVGAKEEETSDFRLVAATNKDLEAMVTAGDFRNDLLFRLRTMHIHIPPLRMRDEDVRGLTIHYMNAICKKYKLPLKGFSPEFLDCLQEYDWPGNVRELVNIMENVIVRAQLEPTLYPKHLPPEVRISVMSGKRHETTNGLEPEIVPSPTTPAAPCEPGELQLTAFDEYKKETEYRYFKALMQNTGADIHKACEVSQLGKQSLYRYLRIHGISTRS